jgi:hydrogenase maturation protein HypF
MKFKTYKVIITGQVQGVGFRPFVYNLAKQCGLKGQVSNNEEGVIICLTGPDVDIQSFITRLMENPPKVAIIDSYRLEEIVFQHFEDFQIIQSRKGSRLNLRLTPDFAICPDCTLEVADPINRRFDYPFTTCVNCGPRWAITNTFPFERDHTSMLGFPMCDECKREYSDPDNRRFHSQTNSCPACGISMQITTSNGSMLDVDKVKIFEKIGKLLEEGAIVALKNTSGYLLCCDATNTGAVQQLRVKKRRPSKPFAVLYPNLRMLQKELSINQSQFDALSSPVSPIVIIPLSNYSGNLALKEVAPKLTHLGVMIPYTGILQLLAALIKFPIVATSGNYHGSPIISDEKECLEALNDIADYFVHHNLPISNPQDDSVLKFSAKYGREVLFRRSRGLAPNFFGKKYSGDHVVMAMGGHLKSTIAFLPNNYMYISQYLGNLDHFDVYLRFTETATGFMDIFEQKPNTLLIDAHPAYLSSVYGLELGQKLQAEVIKIQHHKAHFAAVLGEHDLFEQEEPILGVIWDGTGYGDDGHIWGGEFFKYHSNHMERIAHFDYFNWLAADKMAREPRLSLLSLADEAMLHEVLKKFNEEEKVIYQSLKEKNVLKTSSVGRLFDAVASLLNICDLNTYEGEAAILLENFAGPYNLKECRSYVAVTDAGHVPTKQLISSIYADLRSGSDTKSLIANFLYTLASTILDVAKKQNIYSIAFSGGVFQNTILLDMIIELAQNRYKLYFNRNLSPNDENISFGQINYYLHCMEHIKA